MFKGRSVFAKSWVFSKGSKKHDLFKHNLENSIMCGNYNSVNVFGVDKIDRTHLRCWGHIYWRVNDVSTL